MLSVKNLVQATPGAVRQRSKATNTEIRTVKLKENEDGVRTVIRVRSNTEETFYDTIIEIYPTEVSENKFKLPDHNSGAFVKCSCPFFLFNAEYALARAGSSEIDYSNGKRPVIKNPKETPMLCKHLYAAMPEALKAAQDTFKKSKKYVK